MRSSDVEEGAQKIDSYLDTDAKNSEHTTSFSSTVTTSTYKSTAESSIQIDAVMDADTVRPPPAFDLLAALIEAFKPVVNASRVANLPLKKHALSQEVSISVTKPSTKRDPSTSTTSVVSSDSFQAGSLSSTPSPGRFQQTGPSSNKVGGPQRRELDLNNPESEVALSLLDTISGLVANIARIDGKSAAALTDAMLAVLPVEPEALSCAILNFTEQASVSVEEVIPFILPAIGKAWGNPGEGQIPKESSESLNVTFKDIIAQGSIVINQITTVAARIQAPIMQEVLQQVANAVYAVANHLDQIVCAIGRNDAGIQLDALVPCDSTTIESASVNTLTLNPISLTIGTSSLATATWNIIPTANPEAYDTVSEILPDPYSISSASNPDILQTGRPISSQFSVTDQSVTCTVGTSFSLRTTSPGLLPCPASAPVSTPGVNPKSGPCPETGYQCKDCLNGWFCPPVETPPQVVPCGLGWPCFHCKDGYFCSSTAALDPTAYIPDSYSVPLHPASTEAVETISPTLPSAPTPSHDFCVAVPGWTYLGCFRDAISRTLVGSKPVDYLRGSMSNYTCINHCAANGYSFAGTEHGFECWCGLSIRDDAVRLPENSCNVPCQDSANEYCGGSWVISVFRCAESNAQSGSKNSNSSTSKGVQASTQVPGSSPTVTTPPPYQETQSPSAALETTADSLLYASESKSTQTSSSAQPGPVAKLLANARHSK
ncbi:WSC domain & Core-2/I-Branching protein, partial [Metarhizium hybridum]